MGKEKTVKKITNLNKALETLAKALSKVNNTAEDHEDYIFFRDSLIQRFEYCTDLFWKALREFIINKHGVESPASPKATVKTAFDIDIINNDQYQQLVASINDRNLTSHAYREDVAILISSHILSYYQLMKHIIDKINKSLSI